MSVDLVFGDTRALPSPSRSSPSGSRRWPKSITPAQMLEALAVPRSPRPTPASTPPLSKSRPWNGSRIPGPLPRQWQRPRPPRGLRARRWPHAERGRYADQGEGPGRERGKRHDTAAAASEAAIARGAAGVSLGPLALQGGADLLAGERIGEAHRLGHAGRRQAEPHDLHAAVEAHTVAHGDEDGVLARRARLHERLAGSRQERRAPEAARAPHQGHRRVRRLGAVRPNRLPGEPVHVEQALRDADHALPREHADVRRDAEAPGMQHPVAVHQGDVWREIGAGLGQAAQHPAVVRRLAEGQVAGDVGLRHPDEDEVPPHDAEALPGLVELAHDQSHAGPVVVRAAPVAEEADVQAAHPGQAPPALLRVRVHGPIEVVGLHEARPERVLPPSPRPAHDRAVKGAERHDNRGPGTRASPARRARLWLEPKLESGKNGPPSPGGLLD